METKAPIQMLLMFMKLICLTFICFGFVACGIRLHHYFPSGDTETVYSFRARDTTATYLMDTLFYSSFFRDVVIENGKIYNQPIAFYSWDTQVDSVLKDHSFIGRVFTFRNKSLFVTEFIFFDSNDGGILYFSRLFPRRINLLKKYVYKSCDHKKEFVFQNFENVSVNNYLFKNCLKIVCEDFSDKSVRVFHKVCQFEVS